MPSFLHSSCLNTSGLRVILLHLLPSYHLSLSLTYVTKGIERFENGDMFDKRRELKRKSFLLSVRVRQLLLQVLDQLRQLVITHVAKVLHHLDVGAHTS